MNLSPLFFLFIKPISGKITKNRLSVAFSYLWPFPCNPPVVAGSSFAGLVRRRLQWWLTVIILDGCHLWAHAPHLPALHAFPTGCITLQWKCNRVKKSWQRGGSVVLWTAASLQQTLRLLLASLALQMDTLYYVEVYTSKENWVLCENDNISSSGTRS